jgi:hypothetical protein
MTAVRRLHRILFAKIPRPECRRLFGRYPALKDFVRDYEDAFPDRDDPVHAAAWALKELCVDEATETYNGFDLAARAILWDYLHEGCRIGIDLDAAAPAVLRELDAGGDFDTLIALLSPR